MVSKFSGMPKADVFTILEFTRFNHLAARVCRRHYYCYEVSRA
jgi:hypothetical protein